MKRHLHSALAAGVLAVLLAPALCMAQAGIKWNDESQKQFRAPIEGTLGFHDADKVKTEGDVVALTAYPSSDPGRSDGAIEYAINCKTREIASNKGGNGWSKPTQVIAGETLYPLGNFFCKWTTGPNFLQKLFR